MKLKRPGHLQQALRGSAGSLRITAIGNSPPSRGAIFENPGIKPSHADAPN